MIDKEKRAQVEASIKGDRTAAQALTTLDESELRQLRDEINRMLPADTLGSMDMPSELVAQFKRVKDLQDSVINDTEIPANQRAQVAGQVASTMQQLIKMQTDFYTSERFRSIENMMIAYMKKLPLKEAEAFLNEYERLGDIDGR